MSIAVGAIAFLFVTYFVTDYVLKSRARLNADLVVKTRQLASMAALRSEKTLWEERDTWLIEKQPKLVNEEKAGGQFLEQIKELAKKHAVLIDRAGFRPVARKPEYVAIGLEIDTKSTWRALVAFLGELQTPEQFIVIESGDLTIDGADPTQMRGEKIKIARWYAPK